MRVQFRTEQFEFSHGRKPRGYGFWAFGWNYDGSEHLIMHCGTLTEGKASVKRELMKQYPNESSMIVQILP